MTGDSFSFTGIVYFHSWRLGMSNDLQLVLTMCPPDQLFSGGGEYGSGPCPGAVHLSIPP